MEIKVGSLVRLKGSKNDLIDVIREVVPVRLEDGTVVMKAYGVDLWKVAGINTDKLEVITLH